MKNGIWIPRDFSPNLVSVSENNSVIDEIVQNGKKCNGKFSGYFYHFTIA